MFNTNPWLYYSTTSNKLTNTYIEGILDTSGTIVLRNGGFSLPNGDVSMNGNLYVGLDTNMMSNVNIQGNLVVSERVLQTLSSDPSYNTVNGYYALAKNVQPIVSKQTAYDIGQNWQSAITFTNDVSLNYICWSPKLNLFCAVGSIFYSAGGSNRGIFTSPDGMIWTGRGNAGTYPKCVCWSQEKGIFVLGGRTAGTPRILYSSDGINWTGASTSGLSSNYIQMYWIAELGIFLCVGTNNTNNYTLISYDGSIWTTIYNFPSTSILSSNVCWSPELRIACTFSTNSLYIATNNTLSDFTMITTIQDPSANIQSIAWSSEIGLFCAVSSTGTIFASNDGYNWNYANYGAPSSAWNCITWAPELGIFCTVASGSSTSEYVIISRDGYNWTKAITNIIPNNWQSICWAPEISTFCVVALGASVSGKSDRAMSLSFNNRLPTYLSVKQLLNDANYNINIPSTTSGTFPNFRTIATGPNLINIGNGNYKLVAGALRDSIAIGNTILNTNPTGYGIIGMGQNVFPVLTTGFQNIGIGNAIATSMTTGYNNVFIGNSVATSTSSTGNTVAIGTNAGRTNTTGINNTYLGAFTDASFTTYSNSTAIGYGAVIGTSNEIVLGTITEHIRTPGNPYWLSSFDSSGWISNSTIVAIRPGSAVFSNRITVYNTYYLLVPEFAYGLYLVNITYNLNQGAAFNTFQLNLYQYAFANATTANVPSGNNPANYFLIRGFETIITGGTTTTLGSSMSASYLFEYAPGTTNRAFTFGWLTGALNTTANNDSAWNWVAIHKVA